MTDVQADPEEVAAAAAERADTLAEALTELSGLLLDEENVTTTLQRVTDLSVRSVPGCDGAGVTLVEPDGRYSTAVHTAPMVLAVDQAQYRAGDGPCLTALAERTRVSVAVSEARHRWPRFAAAAEQAGVRSFLAAPLLSGGRTVGSLNLYSYSTDGFDALDETLIALFVAQAGVAVGNARVYEGARRLTEQLQAAMDSRAVIEQAKGVLMARHGLDADGAFTRLRELSQQHNIKLRRVALEVLASTSARPPDPLRPDTPTAHAL